MKPYRKEKLASLIQEIVSDMITYRLHDPRITTLTTVTRVELTGDLTIAKIYLSVMGDEVDERRTMAAINHAAGHIQRRVAGDVQMRQAPQLRFLIDESMKIARVTMALLDANLLRSPSLASAEAGAAGRAGEADERGAVDELDEGDDADDSVDVEGREPPDGASGVTGGPDEGGR